MNREERIIKKINENLSPTHLRVTNQSHNHKHHSGDDGTGETHYDIEITSIKFLGKNRVNRQRIVNNLLQEEFDSGLHAVSMILKEASA